MTAILNQRTALLLMLLLGWCLSACAPEFEETEIVGLPVDVTEHETQQVDVDLVVRAAHEQVQAVLPDAYLRAFLFEGQFESLITLEGKFNMDFIQVRSGFPNRRMIAALASVYTDEAVMDIRFRDLSDHYPSTSQLFLDNGLSIREAARLAYQEITTLGLQSCDVVLTRFDDYWLVVCTVTDSGTLGKRLCEFEIDAATAQLRK